MRYICKILLLLLFASCNQNGENGTLLQNSDFELNTKNKILATTSKVSIDIMNMSVTGINVVYKEKETIYSFKSKKTFYLNGKNRNLSDYEIILANNTINLKTDNNLRLSMKDNKPYIISEKHVGFPNESFYISSEFNILLLVMKELVAELDLKFGSAEYLSNSLTKSGCSFWNTYYVYATGGSSSVAQANLLAEITQYSEDSASCSAIGFMDSGCLWEQYGCVASQAYCCN
jgi:hypothetical protein